MQLIKNEEMNAVVFYRLCEVLAKLSKLTTADVG